MPTTLIEQKPNFTKVVEGEDKLRISEMFVDTIQGEGIFSGCPATFIRLQGCTLQCTWCDTLDVWPHGNEYSHQEVLDMLEPHRDKYRDGRQHLVFTGGSPLKQQSQISDFLNEFITRFGFRPYVECENEAVLLPFDYFRLRVDCWNNSPKLSNSGMKKAARVKPEILHQMDRIPNSWFKFVIEGEEDWEEIVEDFLPYIHREKIILMPQGATQEELNAVREQVIALSIKVGVRYCDRLHVVTWNKKTGV